MNTAVAAKRKVFVPGGLLHNPINKSPVNIDSIEGMTPEKDKKVTGTFLNVECPGQPATVCCKALYRGFGYWSKTFLDGEKAEIPLSVARFINERCSWERHEHTLDEKGNQVKTPKKIYRYKFNIEAY
jgi:hypothetical protein